MARKLSTIYPGKTTVDAANPNGTFKNEVTPGVSNDGTPNEEKWAQDHRGFLDHLLNKAGLTHDGNQENQDDSQYYDALTAVTAGVLSINNHVTLSFVTNSPPTIGFSAGRMVFDDGTGYVPTPAYNKTLTLSSWVAGNNQEGLDTGVPAAPNWYYSYAIYNPTTKLADYLFTLTFGSPTMPAGYTQKEYLGAFYYSFTGIIDPFTQVDNEFSFSNIVPEFGPISTPPSAATNWAITTPAGINTKALVTVILRRSGVGDMQGVVFSPEINDPIPGLSMANLYSEDNNGEISIFTGYILTNISSQIRTILSSTGGSTFLTMITYGWIDPLVRH